ncbi:MAG: aldo/keto reductase [Lachnospiraceae bacterium]|nr:aldo/keto reductase [Lachnospiraceae bacterium]
MQYRNDKNGKPISQLGYGCMRFSKKGVAIDYEKTKAEVLHGIEEGINYLDTAYIYPGSEECLGKILESAGVREKVSIATKLPQYMMRSAAQIEKTFNEELERLRTDYIDYYLMHMFTDSSEWEKLKKLGIEEWISEKKASGAIRNIGFSYHGDTKMFLELLDAYDWDFCQIQYNYLDENSQAGRKGLEAAYAKGIPVIIMEPLRGGKLVNLPESAKKMLNDSTKKYTPAELGLRWLWDQPGVTCVLSGMNSMEMLDENLRIASEAKVGDLTEEDFEIVEKIKAIFKEKEKVGCTGCRYCMPCPKGVDIPATFFNYNLMYMESKMSARFGYAQTVGLRKETAFASQCIGCGKCEKHCPQHIEIRQKLKEADKALRPWYIKAGIKVARAFLKK